MHDMAAMTQADASAMQNHPASESRNPGVDMQAMMPTSRLDDPGIGSAGQRSPRADLCRSEERHSPIPTVGSRAARSSCISPDTWSVSCGRSTACRSRHAEPLRLTYGERVRIVLVNDTMMEHPIHLHGMWSDLEDDEGKFQVRKHTVNMPPGTKRAYRVTADALGRWAYHCHLLYHMEAGMFREVRVDE